jgi:poly(A) polymerase
LPVKAENLLLKRLSGLSRSALKRTRDLLTGDEAGGRSDGKSSRSRNRVRPPTIIPSSDHELTRSLIGKSALKVLDRLHESGHAAYLVGGGVRDALVGLKPKDFDVATDARPEEIHSLFRNSRIIGRRFRLVHVVYGREVIEVATFRAAHNKGDGGETGAAGRIVRDNVYGSIEEDAYRRDFSVNALYYNISDNSIVDYVGGLVDLENGVFRLIGDPQVRCAEDPVRVLRAVRLAAKLDFDIDDKTLKAMQTTSVELRSTPPARLFEEVLKLFQGGYALKSFTAIRDRDLLKYLFPMLDNRLKQENADLLKMLEAALLNTDRRVAEGKPITPYYLLAFMLWPDVEELALQECAGGMAINEALQIAAESVLSRQLRVISIPRRFSGPMKELWQLQPRLERLRGGRALKLMEDRRFRAAYDFLCLRASVDKRLERSADWWTEVQNLPDDMRAQAASKRPVADKIWPSGQRISEDRVNGNESVQAKKKSANRRRRRRRGRKPGGDKSNAPTS